MQKLRLQKEAVLLALHVPDDCITVFDGYKLKKSLAGKTLFRQAILFVNNKAELAKVYNKFLQKLDNDAVIWIAYPKKSSGIITDLIRDDGWDVVFTSDYLFVSSVSINDTWTGMRIKKKDPNVNYLRDKTVTERKTEGIDYVKRTVELPKDAIAAMKSFKGLEAFFNTMSFSHKKEYVEAIVEAKKPETRQRRIYKMIEMVTALKVAKENKMKK